MKYFLIILFLIATPSFAAVAPDVRITDNDCDTLDISASGELMTSSTNETPSGNCGPGAPDVRICDEEGHCLDIASDGSITGVSGAPY